MKKMYHACITYLNNRITTYNACILANDIEEAKTIYKNRIRDLSKPTAYKLEIKDAGNLWEY